MNENKEKYTFQQKLKVMKKLFDAGYNTEKDLHELTIERILKLPNINISEILIIMYIQKYTKSGKLYSYLGELDDEQNK